MATFGARYCSVIHLLTVQRAKLDTNAYDLELRCPEFFKDNEIYDITCLVNITAFPNYNLLDFYVYNGALVQLLCTVNIPPLTCGPVTSGCGCVEFKQEPHVFVYKYKANKAIHQNGQLYCTVAGHLIGYTKKIAESCNQINFDTRGYDIELRCPKFFEDKEIYDITCLVNITTFHNYGQLDFYFSYGYYDSLLCTVIIPPAPQNCGPVTSGCGCLESSNLEPHIFVYKYKANKVFHQNGKLSCAVPGVLKTYTKKTTESCNHLDFEGPSSTSVPKDTNAYDLELRCPEFFKDNEIYDITCLVNITAFPNYNLLDFYVYNGALVQLLCTVNIPPLTCGPVMSGCGCVEFKQEPHVFVYKYKANKAIHQNGQLYCTVAGHLIGYTKKIAESCNQINFDTRGYDIELRCPKFFKDQEIYDITCLVNITTFHNYGQLDFYFSYGYYDSLLCTVIIPPAPQNCGPVTSGCGCLESSNLEPHIFVYKYKANKVFHQNGKLSCAVPGVLKTYTKKTTKSCNQLDFEGPSSTSVPKVTRGFDIELRCPEVFKDQEIYDITCLVNITAFRGYGYGQLEFYMYHGLNQYHVNLLCTVKIPPLPTSCGPVTSGCGCVESSNREPHVFVYKYKANKALHQNGQLNCNVAGVLKSYTKKTTESCKKIKFVSSKSRIAIADFLCGSHGKKWNLAALLFFIQLI